MRRLAGLLTVLGLLIPLVGCHLTTGVCDCCGDSCYAPHAGPVDHITPVEHVEPSAVLMTAPIRPMPLAGEKVGQPKEVTDKDKQPDKDKDKPSDKDKQPDKE